METSFVANGNRIRRRDHSRSVCTSSPRTRASTVRSAARGPRSTCAGGAMRALPPEPDSSSNGASVLGPGWGALPVRFWKQATRDRPDRQGLPRAVVPVECRRDQPSRPDAFERLGVTRVMPPVPRADGPAVLSTFRGCRGPADVGLRARHDPPRRGSRESPPAFTEASTSGLGGPRRKRHGDLGIRTPARRRTCRSVPDPRRFRLPSVAPPAAPMTAPPAPRDARERGLSAERSRGR